MSVDLCKTSHNNNEDLTLGTKNLYNHFINTILISENI
jgi:hypothetical protein